MKVWTIQSKEVLNTIATKGVYQPNFEMSPYLMKNPKLANLYRFILESYNSVNGMNLSALIYGFMQSDGKQIFPIENIDEFYTFINEKMPAIKSFWNNIDKENSVILQLEYKDNFNPLYIDINDFQALMPPVMIIPPYTQNTFDTICRDIQNGIIRTSIFPSYAIQCHLPYISQDNIVQAYSVFDI